MFVALALAALIGCKSAEEVEDGAPQEPQQDATLTEEEARAAAEAMLLALEDLPPGWKQLPLEVDDEDPPFPEMSGECAGLITEENPPGMVAEAETREFTSSDEDVEVQFSSGVFEDAASAAATFETMRRMIGECRDQFQQAFIEALSIELESRQSNPENPFEEPLDINQPTDLEVKGFELSAIEMSGLGDESFAMRMSTFFFVRGSDFATYIDSVGVRVDNLVTGFSYQESVQTPDVAEEREFAAQLEARARQVASQLRGESGGLPGAGMSFALSEATEAAGAAVLTSDDFPEDWTSVKHDSDFTDSLLEGLAGAGLPDLPDDCQLFLNIHLGTSDRGVAEIWSDGFLGYEIGTVTSSVAVFATEEEAKAAIDHVRAVEENCSEPVKNWWARLSEVSQGGPVEVTKYEFGEHSLGSFGDESYALRMEMVAVGPDEDDEIKDIAVVRVGNVVGLLHCTSSWGEPPPDRALEERLLAIIEERIMAAAESLS
jgi:hypothetical protein